MIEVEVGFSQKGPIEGYLLVTEGSISRQWLFSVTDEGTVTYDEPAVFEWSRDGEVWHPEASEVRDLPRTLRDPSVHDAEILARCDQTMKSPPQTKEKRKTMQTQTTRAEITHVLNARLTRHTRHTADGKEVVANYFGLLSVPQVEDDQDLSPFSLAMSYAWAFVQESVAAWNDQNPSSPLPELGEEGDWAGETLRSLWTRASEDHISKIIDDDEDEDGWLRFSVDVEEFDIDKIKDQNGATIEDHVRISVRRKKEVLESIRLLGGEPIWGRNAYYVSCIENGDKDDVLFSDQDDEDEGETDIKEGILDWLGDNGYDENGTRYTPETLRGWGVEKVFPPQSSSVGVKKNADTF